MKRNKISCFVAAMAVILLLDSCKKNEPIEKNPYFQLTPVVNKKITSEVNNEFQLGDVKASKEFYFMLSNGSSQAITDISITSDNPAFDITPTEITRMESKDEPANFISLITLGVKHGLRLNGVGEVPMLPMGKNETNVVIKGMYNSQEISSTFKMVANAKVMDFKMLVDDKEIDYLKPGWGINSTIHSNISLIPIYFTSKTPKISIENTGNIAISITMQEIYTLEMTIVNTIEMILQPHETKTIDYIYKSDATRPIFIFNGEGAITDHKKFHVGSDGFAYIMLFQNL